MFKKSLLTVLIAAISIFAFGAIAQGDQIDGLTNGDTTATAVVQPDGLTLYVNPGGLGDALIGGYYNARNAWDFIRVVNTDTANGVAAKVRFREGHDSQEVLDFFICLSGGDQWSAWIIGDSNAASPASLYWWDNDTPTAPDPNGNDDATDNFFQIVPFHYAATGAAGTVTADDTKEGYFEIIAVNSWEDTMGGTRPVELPSECLTQATASIPVETRLDAGNVLTGSTFIFNVGAGGGTYAYNDTALANFFRVGTTGSLATDDAPKLDATFDVSVAGSDGVGTGIDETNYVLTKTVEYFLYDVEAALGGSTDIIETFPTKKLTIEASEGAIAPIANNGPFNDLACYTGDGTVGTTAGAACITTITDRSESLNGRCEEIAVIIADDEENSPTTSTGFSPGETSTLTKCDEVNYITVGSGASLLDTSLLQFKLNTTGFQLGWVGINLSVDSSGTPRTDRVTNIDTATNDTSAAGLPVIAYSLQGMIDGFLTHMLPAAYTTVYTNTTPIIP